jgi:DtxR family Mn-dependent transcriptional regulator
MKAGASERLSERQEDYLEAILRIEQRKSAARATDISRELGVSSSSVTGALQSLAGKGLVNYQPYDLITLTASGRSAARRISRRHRVLRRFLEADLGVEAREAEATACRLEHVLSERVVERLVDFLRRQARP